MMKKYEKPMAEMVEILIEENIADDDGMGADLSVKPAPWSLNG